MGSKVISKKVGVLLLQLGTPDAPTTSACRRFLREFLMDPYVIDLPLLPRWLLVNLIIAPFRAPKSAHAYQQIWTLEGGPLRFHSLAFEAAVRATLGSETPVALGMRYGNPSVQSAWRRLQAEGVSRVFMVPLYPQYAESSFRTASEAAEKELRRSDPDLKIDCMPPFYSADFFIQGWKAATAHISWKSYDHILFSYHGVPERHLTKLSSQCLSFDQCCDQPRVQNQTCYRHHCFETTRALVAALQLPKEKTSTSFQSRLGRTPWIRPYTDEVIIELAKRGSKNIAVMSPSFVVDGLETLEEIGIRGRESFLAAGGNRLDLISSLNAEKSWVNFFCDELKHRIAALR